MTVSRSIGKVRRKMYRGASLLGDLQAISTGKPDRIAKRFFRKAVWRKLGGTARKVGL